MSRSISTAADPVAPDFDPTLALADIFHSVARARPDAPALVSDRLNLSYAGLARRTDAVAARLLD
ncbi:hypothetical protein FAZ78_19730, partial [Cereibacter changlensis]